MNSSSERHPRRAGEDTFWAIPDWHLVRYFLLLTLIQCIWFMLVYVSCNELTARRQLRLRVHLEVEESLPFVPSAIVVYSSVYVYFYVAPFILRTRLALRRLAFRIASVILLAGICFLLFPAEPDFAYPSGFGICDPIFRLSDQANLDYNQVPSLHVALPAVCAAAYSRRAGINQRTLIWGGVIAIAVAAVLAYQHHVVDVITGLLLGAWADRSRMLDRAERSLIQFFE